MVIWSKPATVQLRAIHDYIAADSRFYAKKVVQEIREKTEILNSLPQAGRKIPELNMDHVRELAIYSYRLIYELRDGQVYVLAVVHRRQEFSPEMMGGE